MPYNSLAGSNLDIEGEPEANDFVRYAMADGFRTWKKTGVYPYPQGFIASTDTHLGTPGAVDEASFPGHGGAGQNNRDEVPPGLPDHVTASPGGLAVLWAEENSRDALFAAMKRREAYATSGPRIVLRTFAGEAWPDDVCADPDLPTVGYGSGVPMGGELPPETTSVSLLIDAAADPSRMGQPLEQLQVIKGSLVLRH